MGTQGARAIGEEKQGPPPLWTAQRLPAVIPHHRRGSSLQPTPRLLPPCYIRSGAHKSQCVRRALPEDRYARLDYHLKTGTVSRPATKVRTQAGNWKLSWAILLARHLCQA